MVPMYVRYVLYIRYICTYTLITYHGPAAVTELHVSGRSNPQIGSRAGTSRPAWRPGLGSGTLVVAG